MLETQNSIYAAFHIKTFPEAQTNAPLIPNQD